MINIFKKRALAHSHTPELVGICDEYHTTYTDKPGTKQNWQMRFYKCSCGDRTYSHNLPKYHTHAGMEACKLNWIDSGTVPNSTYHPTEVNGYKTIDEIEKLDPILAYQKTLDGIKDALGVVINRDFDLETQYPELKKAADAYHATLDKYRTLETLKKDE